MLARQTNYRSSSNVRRLTFVELDKIIRTKRAVVNYLFTDLKH